MATPKSQPPLPSSLGQSSSVRGTAGDATGLWPPHAGEVPTKGQCEDSAPQRAVLATGETPAGLGPALRPLTSPAQPGPRPHTTDMLGDPEAGGRGSRGPFSRSPVTPGGVAGEGFTSPHGPRGTRRPQSRGGSCSPSSSPSPEGARPVGALPTSLLPSPALSMEQEQQSF